MSVLLSPFRSNPLPHTTLVPPSFKLVPYLHQFFQTFFSSEEQTTKTPEYTGISYGDRLWFKDMDAASIDDDDKEDYLGNIQIDS